MNKGDAILRLLMEMKLELKEVKEQMEQMQTSLKNIEKQNQTREIPSTVSKKQQDWKYPSKMK
ncbi:hypothetical protein [Bacillus pseudomycoides]|uniref:Preprotein translocase n=1 Tax=Bacillus pseudomycoides TaxID=64104 RepID=A0A2B6I5W6_9BACI|nr:hypothetical protein [Bacillus pseudomycoides]PDY43915.1 hypothetical protein CON79_28595 [Bacillus pseudomycoides]PEA81365.1 hypothetical protein CON99_22975 [Bacillus pseudomycoides]PED07626.1 hypothetical protein COO19_14435 [Bacillus pseudomycoides]PED69288.1 hypothetical protein CON97_26100 [Bacillus pseudomycoides]PEE37334.1 hypothetical protein COO02_24240 [Bacillus pseudomycoides]